MNRSIFLIAAFVLAGCANTDTALMRESAITIGGSVRPDSVQLQNVDRGITTVTWDAVTSEGAFNCSADDMLKRVRCVPRN